MLDGLQIATLLKQIFVARSDVETYGLMGMEADAIPSLYESLAEEGEWSSGVLSGASTEPEEAPSEPMASLVCPPCSTSSTTSDTAGETQGLQEGKTNHAQDEAEGGAEWAPSVDAQYLVGARNAGMGGDGMVGAEGMDVMNNLGGEINGNGTGGVVVANQPKLIVSNYSLSPESPRAGQDFNLKLTFRNTNTSKSVRNIKITLGGGEAQIDTKVLSDSGQQTGITSGGGSVFTPVGSSNTFYIAKISPEHTGEMEITLRTSPTVAAQAYALNVSYEYEDKEGNQYSGSETIGIPVTQEAKILLGDVMTQTEGQPLMAGMPTSLDMEIFNIGKDNLSTFMVSIEGEGFDVTDSPRYFIGAFAPGASDRYSVEIMPTAELAKGDIVITYEDSTGATHEERQPFSFEVEGVTGEATVNRDNLFLDDQTGYLTDGSGNYYDQTTLEPVFPEPSSGVPIVPIAVVALIALLVGIFFWRKHKKNKADRKELDLDA